MSKKEDTVTNVKIRIQKIHQRMQKIVERTLEIGGERTTLTMYYENGRIPEELYQLQMAPLDFEVSLFQKEMVSIEISLDLLEMFEELGIETENTEN